MAICPDCGAEISHARTREGEHVPLDKFTDPTGTRRYRIVDTAVEDTRTMLIVEPVADSAPLEAYPDHRKDCPAHGRGLID